MLINGVAKLQTPRSKLGLSPDNEKETRMNILAPKQLSYIPEDSFVRDDNDNQTAFKYQSPVEIMLQELKVSIL